MLGHQLRLEAAVTVARDVYFHLALVGPNLLAPLAVAAIFLGLRRFLTLFVTQVMAHLRVQGPVDQGSRKLLQQLLEVLRCCELSVPSSSLQQLVQNLRWETSPPILAPLSLDDSVF